MQKRSLLPLVGAIAAIAFACAPFGADDVVAPQPTPDAGSPGVDAGDAGATRDAGAEASDDDGGPKKRVFVTAGDWPGALVLPAKGIDGTLATSGPAAGDVLCADDAKKAGVPGKFRAWLSSSDEHARTRFADTGPRHDTQGRLVLGKVGAPPITGIPGPDGKAFAGEVLIWTGTNEDGAFSGADCTTWAGVSPLTGTIGDSRATDGRWTKSGVQDCGARAHLLCIEQ